jgi:hypothetical protein
MFQGVGISLSAPFFYASELWGLPVCGTNKTSGVSHFYPPAFGGAGVNGSGHAGPPSGTKACTNVQFNDTLPRSLSMFNASCDTIKKAAEGGCLDQVINVEPFSGMAVRANQGMMASFTRSSPQVPFGSIGTLGYAGMVPAQLPMFTIVVSAAAPPSKATALKIANWILRNGLAIGICLAVVGLLVGAVAEVWYHKVFVSDFRSVCCGDTSRDGYDEVDDNKGSFTGKGATHSSTITEQYPPAQYA